MTLPFTSEVFLSLFARYNAAVWPAQVAAYLAGFAIFAAALRPFPGSDRLVAGLLAAMWLWTGAVYHWTYFTTINFFAPAFAALFVMQGLLLAWTGAVKGRLSFRLGPDRFGWLALATMLWGLAVYPLTNLLAGHFWPAMPAFGLTPCPTMIFTMGALLAVAGRTPWHLVVLPIVWSLVGGSAAALLAMPEDLVLPVAGLGGAALIAWKNRAAMRANAAP
jgi:hypothetical protein